jgi:pimeloyl-ACP methyl ester carboxylesterase
LSFPLPAVAKRLGLRVIAVERPGLGRSDVQPGRTILDWPRDLAALADCLGLQGFAVAGVSGAGPYLLAAAYALPERVRQVVMIGCIGPTDGPDAESGMAWSRRAYFALTRRSPWLAARLLTTAFADRQQLQVERFYRAMTGGLSESDQRVLARPEIWDAQIANCREALAAGLAGFVAEVSLAAGRWGFSLRDVKPPVELWHGTDDRSTPLTMARSMARELPDAVLHVLEGEGHFLMHAHGDAILAGLAGGGSTSRLGRPGVLG